MKTWLSPGVVLCTKLLFIATSLWGTGSYAAQNMSQELPGPALGYRLLAERSHDAHLFTQGLLVADNRFYESSGLYGKSKLVSYYVDEPAPNWASIALPFVQQHTLADEYFAEGLAHQGNQLFLLSWQEKTLFVLDKHNLQLRKTLPYEGEGWGLTSDGEALIRSDGSDQLFFHRPDTFALTKTVQVRDNNHTINYLNELEFAQGFIWANVWYQDYILKIDPTSGQVLGHLDLAALKQSLTLSSREFVLNGIAWDETRQAFWVTGKNWPKLFLIKVEE